jgi:isoleucyl-tRNA synthetase
VRLSRERLKNGEDQTARQVLGHTLYVLAQLFAPFTPFTSEVMYQVLISDQDSIHLSNWPEVKDYSLNEQLVSEMSTVRQVVEMALAERQTAGIRVRQPLASVKIALSQKLSQESALTEVIANELNVKQVVWEPGEQLKTTLDINLTPELKAEGEARDIMRQIQKLRKTQGLQPADQATATLPSWPEDWTAEIERKTRTKLTKGEEWSLQRLSK